MIPWSAKGADLNQGVLRMKNITSLAAAFALLLSFACISTAYADASDSAYGSLMVDNYPCPHGCAAIAASDNGLGSAYADNDGMGYLTTGIARLAAIAKCESTWGGICSLQYATVAEDRTWGFAAGMCNGRPIAGASGVDYAGAVTKILEKAIRLGLGNCKIFALR